MSIQDQIASLASGTVPQIASQYFPFTMSILADRLVEGDGGGQIKEGTDEVYADVPVIYQIKSTQKREESGEGLASFQQFILTFPTHKEGSRINVDPETQFFRVNAQGHEPEKVFTMISAPDVLGILYKAVCEKVN